MSIKVIDDFIPESYQKLIQENVIDNMKWMYLPSVSGVDDHGSEFPNGIHLSADQDTFYMDIHHPIDGTNDIFMMGLLLNLANMGQIECGFDNTIERVRIATYHKVVDGGIHRPHVDYYYPHHTMIYYVNDSDGDTIVYNQYVENMDRSYPKKFTILDRISPKKGRAVIIDGLHYHSSSPPMNTRIRTAINFNYVPIGGGEKDNNWSIIG